MTLKIGYEPIKGDPEDDSCDHSDNDDTQDCLLYTSKAGILLSQQSTAGYF